MDADAVRILNIKHVKLNHLPAMCIPAALLAVGGLIIVYGSFFPQYLDVNWQTPFLSQNWHDRLRATVGSQAVRDNKAFNAMADQWFAARQKALSPRDACYDTGAAVFLFGLTIGGLFLACRTKTIQDIAGLTAPKTRLRFLSAVVLTWISFVPAEWIYYIYTDARGEYPWFGDIIFIPMVGSALFCAITLPVVFCGSLFVLGKGRLPSELFSKPVFTGSWFVDVTIGFCVLIAIGLMGLGITQQPPVIIPATIVLYLILSARAARSRVVLPSERVQL